MDKLIKGIHHVTAIASDAQKNLDFYAGVLGLRLVKKTINFDAPSVYHLYYGDKAGSPGTILTFFPFTGIPQGRRGKGQLTVTSFSIPENSLSYWLNRFHKFQVKYNLPERRFEDQVVYFEDFDGLGLEFVTTKNDPRQGFTYGNIPLEFSIKGFYGITLTVESCEKTGTLLMNQMNYQKISENESRYRFSANGKVGDFVDVVCSPDAIKGTGGYGTVHHVAFATDSDATQLQMRQKLMQAEMNVTPVLERQYFHSIYFREPGGVLFEVATLPPGFTIDEPLEHLGESLQLPPWEQPRRELIEKILPPIGLNLSKYAD